MSWLARFLVLGLLLAQSLPAQVSWCTAPDRAVQACLDGDCCQVERPAPEVEEDCCQSAATVAAPALAAAKTVIASLDVAVTPLPPTLPADRPSRIQRPPATAPPTPHPFFHCIRLLI